MYESFIKDLAAHKKVEVKLDLSQNMILNPQLLWNKLSDIENIDDRELYNILSNYLDKILEEIFTNKNTRFISLFTTPKFISTLTQVLYNISVTDSQKKKLNKMAYDYLIKKNDKDEYVSSLLSAMAKVVNRDVIPSLCGLGMPESVAAMLAMARFSNEKDIINVRRLNHILMQQPPESITEQLIIDIYCKLFDHMLALFEGVMLDVVSPQNMSSGEAEIYGLITLAILDIFEALPMDTLRYGLTLFEQDKRVLYSDYHVRINLESCSPQDYPRLIAAIDALKLNGIYMPTF